MFRLRNFRSVLVVILCILYCTTSLAENFTNVIKRNGLYYDEVTNLPYNGEVKLENKGFGGPSYVISNYCEGLIFNGRKEGLWISYNKNWGVITSKIVWKKGKEVEVKIYSAKGTLSSESIIDGDKIYNKFYYENGDLRSVNLMDESCKGKKTCIYSASIECYFPSGIETPKRTLRWESILKGLFLTCDFND